MIEVNFFGGSDHRVNQHITFIYVNNGASNNKSFIHFPVSKLCLSTNARSSLKYYGELKVSAEESTQEFIPIQEQDEYFATRALDLQQQAVVVTQPNLYLAIAANNLINIITTHPGGETTRFVSVVNTTKTKIDIYWYMDGSLIGVAPQVTPKAQSSFQNQLELVFCAHKITDLPNLSRGRKKPVGDTYKAVKNNNLVNVKPIFKPGKPEFSFHSNP